MYPANTNTSICSNFPHFFSKAQLHRERIELLQHHTTYNTTDTELMLYRRVRIRRQKRLAWNMITQREAYVWKLLLLFDCFCGSWFFFVCGVSSVLFCLFCHSVSSVCRVSNVSCVCFLFFSLLLFFLLFLFSFFSLPPFLFFLHTCASRYTRKVIVAAHELWSKVLVADFRHLLADKEEQRKLLQDNFGSNASNASNLNNNNNNNSESGGGGGSDGVAFSKPSERQVYELTFQLSTRKLKALMKESIKKMKRFHVSSIRFEGHTVLGDCVAGWMEKDNKGRPKLR